MRESTLHCSKLIGVGPRARLDMLEGFHEDGHIFTAGVRDDSHRQLVQAIVDVLGYKSGPLQLDIKLTPQGPKVIDIGYRFSGDGIATHVERVAGQHWGRAALAPLARQLRGAPALVDRRESCQCVGRLVLRTDRAAHIAKDLAGELQLEISASDKPVYGPLLPDGHYGRQLRNVVHVTTSGTEAEVKARFRQLYETLIKEEALYAKPVAGLNDRFFSTERVVSFMPTDPPAAGSLQPEVAPTSLDSWISQAQ